MERTSSYFDRLLPRLQANGTDIDVIGYSYYPIFHSGGITAVQQNLNNSAAAYGKPVVIVEAGFPSRNPTQAEQNLGFAVTEAGQQAYFNAVVDAVENVPNELGQGVFWWYAEARPTSGLNVYQNGRYGLFDQNGNLNDAASVFEQFLPARTATSTRTASSTRPTTWCGASRLIKQASHFPPTVTAMAKLMPATTTCGVQTSGQLPAAAPETPLSRPFRNLPLGFLSQLVCLHSFLARDDERVAGHPVNLGSVHKIARLCNSQISCRRRG